MKICDLTQFYSPRSGGVKRYLHEKIAYVQTHSREDEHLLIVPGERDERRTSDRSRVYTVASPLVSRTTRYRALLDLREVEEIIARERPDIIESSDPYQLGWAAAAIARRHRIPAVAYCHSDFAQAYLRPIAERFGDRVTSAVMHRAGDYVRALYNLFDVTFAPSEELAARLRQHGVRRVHVAELGVNTDAFTSTPDDSKRTRAAHNIPADAALLIYVGRLAPEKNTSTLFEAFQRLSQRRPSAFHLVVIGDGQQRGQLARLRQSTAAVTWLPYCSDAAHLAQWYRSADLFVHPGIQETFGLVALESQACGTPVVGIRGSAMDRIILHDQESWAPENSPAALAEAIDRTLARDLQRMGVVAAAAVAERYSWRRVFDGLFCIYREVCAQYRRSAVA